MIAGKTTKKVNFGPLLSALDLSGVLNDAAALVKKDIQDRYKNDIDLDGSATTPLADSTIERKKKAGYKNPAKPLVATGNMWRNQKITKATKSRQVAKIEIGTTRDVIYSYHHEGGDYLPARPKFGIGEGVDAKIDRLAILRIERALMKL